LPGAVAKEFAESFNVKSHPPLTVATVQQLIHNVCVVMSFWRHCSKELFKNHQTLFQQLQVKASQIQAEIMLLFLGLTLWIAIRKTSDNQRYTQFQRDFCSQELVQLTVGDFGTLEISQEILHPFVESHAAI